MDARGILASIWGHVPLWTPEVTWYFAAFALVFPVEAVVGAERSATWSERAGNVVAMGVHAVVGGVMLQVLLLTPAGTALTAFPRNPRHPVLENPYLWAFASVAIVDAAFYVYHRLQHALPLFWRIHKLHHTDPAMNVTTSRRTHFLERMFQYVCLTVPMFWILGMNLEGMTYAAIATTFFLYAGHADIRLDIGALTPLVVGPLYHRLHHSRLPEHRDVNFAQVFPVFDMIGGTYRRPTWHDYPETGVEGCDTATSRWRPLLW